MKRQTRPTEVIRALFDAQRHRTDLTILLFLLLTASFGCLVNALSPLMALYGRFILINLGFALKPLEHGAFANAFGDLLGPILGFLFFFLLMWFYFLRNRRIEETVTLDPPQPHQGLILMLSTYNSRNQSSLKSVDDVLKRLSEADASEKEMVREELLKSNWGTLVMAVEHHAVAPLEHCWIVCTQGGSFDQFGVAKRVVHWLTGPQVQCHRVEATDPHDISTIVPLIEEVYRKASAHPYNLDPNTIIADFTGGTAAMSGGMILATLEEARKIEYVRQDRPPFTEGRAMTPAEISTQKILITVRTTPALVPEKPST
jgi:hypothetical protein